MGYNNDNARRLVFDIETAPLPEAAEYLEPCEAPANYKDPIKIEAYIKEQSAKELERCGLDVDLCRVVALGMWYEGADGVGVLTTEDVSEANLLRSFWAQACDFHLVGFNCLGFDLPVLLRRSLYLGIQAPRIQIDRFKHPQVTDLMDDLSFGGKLKLRGLDFYCRRFGISVPDTMKGADVAAAVNEGRWADVEAHVKADVMKTAALAERMGSFSHQVAEAVL